MASGERAAVNAAVNSLVFSHTHVVRLRVTRGGAVLADVGGSYILAPVGGTLRFGGRPVGRYLLSVQDDLGYVKLATRFIGAPIVLRTGSRTVPVEGVLAPGPARIPDHGPVSYRNTAYEAFSFNASAFPSGPLRISLLLPLPRSLAARDTCAEIKNRELGRVAQRISAPLRPGAGQLLRLHQGHSDAHGAGSSTSARVPATARRQHAAGTTAAAERRLADLSRQELRGVLVPREHLRGTGPDLPARGALTAMVATKRSS